MTGELLDEDAYREHLGRVLPTIHEWRVLGKLLREPTWIAQAA